MNRRKEVNNESNLQIKVERDFFEWSDQFEEELVEDLFDPLERKEIEHPYVELQVQDAETIEIETKKEDNEFFDLKQKFNVIDNTATEQIKQNDLIDLVHDMLNENNPFNKKMKAEDISIETNLFDNTHSTDKTKKVSDGVFEKINFGDTVEIPSDDEVAVDGPKKIIPIPNPNSIRLASNRIIKKYWKTEKRKV